MFQIYLFIYVSKCNLSQTTTVNGRAKLSDHLEISVLGVVEH